MNKKLTLAVAATAVAGLIALVRAPLFSQSGAASQPTIQGVWRVTEITTTGPNASKNSSPQPSLYIYTAKHYSLIRINGTTPRPDLPTDQVAKATAAQLLAVYGPVLSAQSGTYEAAGGKLTTRAIVATVLSRWRRAHLPFHLTSWMVQRLRSRRSADSTESQ